MTTADRDRVFAPMTRPDWAVLWLWLVGVFGLWAVLIAVALYAT